ncbi:MAG: hypothetical protein Q9217_000197 [Psora testacea]
MREMRILWQEHGEVCINSNKLTGRKPKINSDHEKLIKDYIDANPDAYDKDVANYLAANCKLEVNRSTVWRMVHKRGWLKDRPKQRRLRDPQGQWLRAPPRDENGGNVIRSAERHKDAGRKPKGDKKARWKANDKLLEKTRDFVKAHMSDPRFDGSHDYGHVQRVTAMAMHLLRCEQAAHPETIYDPLVVEVAALVHDIEDQKYLYPPPPSHQQPHVNCTPHQHHPQQPDFNLPQAHDGPGLLPYNDPPPQHKSYHGYPSQAFPSQNKTAGGTSPRDPIPAEPLRGPDTTNPPPRSFPWPAGFPPPSRPPAIALSQESPAQLLTPPATTMPPTTDPTALQTTALATHLKTLNTPPHLIHILCTIIPCVSHSYSTQHPGLIQHTIQHHPELAILQDADRLDALGAVGIARAFTFGGARGRHLEDTLEHFHEKLNKLEAGMWTAEGRRLARARTEKLHTFRAIWDEEVKGRDYLNTPEGIESQRLPNGVPSVHNSGDTEPAIPSVDGVAGPGAEQGQDPGYAAHADRDMVRSEMDSGLQLSDEMYGTR